MGWTKEQIEEKRMSIVGKKFGKLLVIEFIKSENKRMWYRCKCDCGKIITRRKDTLSVSGNNSCGCDQLEKIAIAQKSRKKILDIITTENLQDKQPKEAIEVIMKFKGVDYYDAYHLYHKWREQYKKGNVKACIRK